MDVNLTVVLLFLSVAGATGALAWLLTEPQTTRRRLSQVAQGAHGELRLESVLEDTPTEAVKRARSYLPKSPKSMNRVQRQMTAAGYQGHWPAIIFSVVQIVLPLAVFGAVYSVISGPSRLVFAGLAALVGYYATNLWLGMKIEERKTQIRNG